MLVVHALLLLTLAALGALSGAAGRKVDHVAEAFLAQRRYMHQLDEAKRSRVVQTLRERRLGAVDIAKVLAKNEEMHGGRILNHHFTDVHQLNQDGFTGGWPSGITDSRLPSLRNKPFDENGFQMLDNLAPLLPGEENPWPYETNPHWRHDACYDINVHSRTNPNISITASSFGKECPEDLGAGRSIPWCPTFDSKYTAERVDCIWSKY